VEPSNKSDQPVRHSEKYEGSQEVTPSSPTETMHKTDETKKAENNPQEKSYVRKQFSKLWFYVKEAFTKEKSAAWTAVFTLVLTIFTGLLVYIAFETDQTARDTQRAFVGFKEIQHTSISIDPKTDKVLQYGFSATYENSGTTPAKRVTAHINAVWPADQLPPGFNYPDTGDIQDIPFVIGPKGTTVTLPVWVLADAISDVRDRKKHLYVYGHVSYHDIFKGDPEHVTEFCMEIVNLKLTGDTYDRQTRITGVSQFCPSHNCYDEDCKE
jgi:hypothetical protein